ncbi:dihydroorotase family protein [Candidatus Bathyarchaeota archaeon]|nr:dihydroorotase family protein [Candidatus Bathyarchaeota archaeon]
MTVDTLLINGKLLQADKLTDSCIAFHKGKISYIGEKASAPDAKERIDLEGGIILPGLIDAHTHLRDMELTQKEDFFTGTCSALVGGFTTVFDMPNTIPLTDSPEHLNQKLEVARSKIVANVAFYGAFTATMEYVKDMAALGIVGFKLFTTKHQPLDGDDDKAVEKALSSAKSVGLPVAFHAEDIKTIESVEMRLKASGDDSLGAFSVLHTPRTESLSVARILALSMMIGARVHFCHLSTAESLQNVKEAKSRGLPVTCEVGPHHLFLSDKEILTQGGVAIVDPPLRKRRHLQALFKGLLDGHIDFVASDHAPHVLREKISENVWNISPGFPGLETTLPVMLTTVNEGKLTLKRLIEVLSEKPAKIFGLRTKGRLSEGFDGDITIVDMKREFVIDPQKFQSKAKYSPFKGFKAFGKPVKVFVGGRLVMSEGEILAEPGSGSVLRRT